MLEMFAGYRSNIGLTKLFQFVTAERCCYFVKMIYFSYKTTNLYPGVIRSHDRYLLDGRRRRYHYVDRAARGEFFKERLGANFVLSREH
jgi:hypothetical protein